MSIRSRLPEFGGGERFTIIRRLGVGGMGVVYEARDEQTGMRVAIKTLQALEPRLLHRFKEEFRNFADVVHPNVAVLHELLSDGETWFFTMEMIDGVDFLDFVVGPEAPDTLVDREETSILAESELGLDDRVHIPATVASPVGDPEALERLRLALGSLAEGVNALHRANRVHRDLKPSNVLVTEEGRSVILDFGISTTLKSDFGSRLNEGVISGTVLFMAPEQMSRVEEVTPAADWYAVGTMLYQALTGEHPFTGRAADILVAKRRGGPRRPSQLVADVPPDLEELCMQLLSRDPGDRPSGPEILERLGVDKARAVATREIEENLLVGRERELALLGRAVEQVRAGETVTAFVHGRSGAGKTYLVERFLSELQRSADTDVFFGRCYEAETVPYKSLDNLIDAIARHLVRRAPLPRVPIDIPFLTRIFPVLQQVPQFNDARHALIEIPNRRELRRRAVAALRDLLVILGEETTVVLCIDDLQWGDADSASVLLEVLRQPGAPRLLLLGIYRAEYETSSEPLRQLLDATSTDESSRYEVSVEPLSGEDSRELAARLLGDARVGADMAAAIAEESGGVPYFIYELVRYTREHPEHLAGSLGVSLTEVLSRRFNDLSDESRKVLEVISVIGRPLRRGDAFRATELPPEARAAFGQLRGSSMIRSTGSGEDDLVEAYHDRIRETMVEKIPRERVEQHYGRLATTLEQAGTYDPETVGICFRGSGQYHRAGDYYELGADQAVEALAFERAANLYRQAIELRPGLSTEKRSELLERRAEALANAGHAAEAARVFRKAIEGADHERAIELQRLSAYHFCSSGRLDEGRAAMEALLASQGLTLPRSPVTTIVRLLWNRARLWTIFRRWQRNPRSVEMEGAPSPEALRTIDVTWSASAGMSMMDIVLGAAFQAYNLILALRAGEPYRIARAMSWEAAHTSNGGSDAWTRTVELIDAADRLARRVDHPQASAMVLMGKGISEFTMGRFADAVVLLDEAEEIFRNRCTGVTWEIDTTNTFKMWGLIYQGRFEETARRTSVLVREAEERGDLYASTNLQSFMVPHVHLAQDEPGLARAAVAASQRRWAQEGFHLQNLTGLMGGTLIELYEGNGRAALERLDGNWKTIKNAQILRIQILRILLRHFRGRSALLAATSANGSARSMLRIAETEAARLSKEGVPWAQPMELSLRAGIASHESDPQEAIRLATEAATGFEEAGLLSYAAAARRRTGELAGDSDQVDQADERMRGLGVMNPESMARMHLPGFRTGR